MSILNFADRETEKIFYREFSRKLPQSIQQTALRKLIYMDEAQTLNDLRVPPSNHLEALKGERLGQYSIRINNQYRICFNTSEEGFYNVEIIDYH